MDMLISGPLHTLEQGQRSRVIGTADPGENGEDESKAWQNERMAFLKENGMLYSSFCPNWMLFFGKVVAEGKSKRKIEKHRISHFVFYFILFISTVTGQDSEAYLHTSESSFAYQTFTKPHGACTALMCSMEQLYFYILPNGGLMGRPGGARDDKPSLQSASSGEAALSSQVFQVENIETRCCAYLRRRSAVHPLANGGEPVRLLQRWDQKKRGFPGTSGHLWTPDQPGRASRRLVQFIRIFYLNYCSWCISLWFFLLILGGSWSDYPCTPWDVCKNLLTLQ